MWLMRKQMFSQIYNKQTFMKQFFFRKKKKEKKKGCLDSRHKINPQRSTPLSFKKKIKTKYILLEIKMHSLPTDAYKWFSTDPDRLMQNSDRIWISKVRLVKRSRRKAAALLFIAQKSPAVKIKLEIIMWQDEYFKQVSMLNNSWNLKR